MRKRRVLLIWWEIDTRPEYLQPFIEMGDEIEFIQLIYKNKEERTTSISPFKMIYWHEYRNAQSVLKDIKPDVIIGVTEGIFCAALIHASKAFKIPYYGLQHGYTPENISNIQADLRKYKFDLVKSYVNSTLFFLMSFSLFKTKKFFSAMYFYWLYPRTHIYKILTDHNFPWLIPDHYICFSEYAAEHYKNMYGLKNDQIKYIGILWFDKLFREFARIEGDQTLERNKYFLLIDTSFIQYSKPISQEQVNRCYEVLSDFCEREGAKLIIKLHPFNYDHDSLLQKSNIEYVRKVEDDELTSLIAGCEGCFGFYSTLIFPILGIKPVIQIAYDDIYMKLLEDKALTPVIDFYTFTLQDINFPAKEITDIHRKELDYLIYKTDGLAAHRLKTILLSA